MWYSVGIVNNFIIAFSLLFVSIVIALAFTVLGFWGGLFVLCAIVVSAIVRAKG